MLLRTDEKGEQIQFKRDVFNTMNYRDIFATCSIGEKGCRRVHFKQNIIINSFANNPAIWFDYAVYAIKDMRQKFNRIYRMFEPTNVMKSDARPCYKIVDGQSCTNRNCKNIHEAAKIESWYLEHPDEWVIDFLYRLNKPFKAINTARGNAALLSKLEYEAKTTVEHMRKEAIEKFQYFKDNGKLPITVQWKQWKGSNSIDEVEKTIRREINKLTNTNVDDVVAIIGKIISQYEPLGDAAADTLNKIADVIMQTFWLDMLATTVLSEYIIVRRTFIEKIRKEHPVFIKYLRDFTFKLVKNIEKAFFEAFTIEDVILDEKAFKERLSKILKTFPTGYQVEVDLTKPIYNGIANLIGFLEVMSENGRIEAYNHILQMMITYKKSIAAIWVVMMYLNRLGSKELSVLMPSPAGILNKLVEVFDAYYKNPSITLEPDFNGFIDDSFAELLVMTGILEEQVAAPSTHFCRSSKRR